MTNDKTPPPRDEHDDEEKPWVRTHTPRPDELSRESFEFIAAIDHYKRKYMRSFLSDREVLEILAGLGYSRGRRGEPSATDLTEYAEARARYRKEHGRLFPTWSEIFDLLIELGYRRDGRGRAA